METFAYHYRDIHALNLWISLNLSPCPYHRCVAFLSTENRMIVFFSQFLYASLLRRAVSQGTGSFARLDVVKGSAAFERRPRQIALSLRCLICLGANQQHPFPLASSSVLAEQVTSSM